MDMEGSTMKEITGRLTEEMHPLVNPVVLTEIFGYCSFKDIKSCRGVSKAWRANSRKAWNSLGVVTITRRNGSDFRKFLKASCFDDSGRLYSNFHVSGFICTRPIWGICGPNIKVLTLVYCKFKNVDDFRYAIFKCCTNLKRLTLVHVHVKTKGKKNHSLEDVVEPEEWIMEPGFRVNENLKYLKTERRSGNLRISWMEIFNRFPSLECLELLGSDANDDGLFKSLNLIRQSNPSKLKLKEIRTLDWKCNRSEVMSSELLLFLSNPSMCLESLSMGVNGSDVGTGLCDVLNTHSASLKTLELFRSDIYPPLSPYQCIPSLDKGKLAALQEIQLHSRTFTSLSFLKATPNLRKLVILGNRRERQNHGADDDDDDENIIADTIVTSDLTDVRMKKCTELVVEHPTTERELEHLAVWLPNLTKLTLSHLTDEKFSLVCKKWPNLIELNVTESEVENYGLTGLDASFMEKFLGESKEEIWKLHDVLPLPPSKNANVTDLKDLQKFSMKASDPDDGFRLVYDKSLHYCTVLFGFDLLPKLKSLSILNYELHHFSLWDQWCQRMKSEKGMLSYIH